MASRKFQFPVDTICSYGALIAVGSYHHRDGLRTGLLQLVDPRTLDTVQEFPTSGTLHATCAADAIYCANADSVEAYGREGRLFSFKTAAICTYVWCGTVVAATTTAGELHLLDYELRLRRTVQVCNGTIWVAREIDGQIFLGLEDGRVLAYSLKEETIAELGGGGRE